MAPGPGRALAPAAPAAPARSAAPLGRDLEDLVEMCTKLGQVPARPATPLSKEGKSLHQNNKRMILFRREIQRNADAAFRCLCDKAFRAAPEAAECLITFGKHCGKTVREVPKKYLEWVLQTPGVYANRPELAAALRSHQLLGKD